MSSRGCPGAAAACKPAAPLLAVMSSASGQHLDLGLFSVSWSLGMELFWWGHQVPSGPQAGTMRTLPGLLEVTSLMARASIDQCQSLVLYGESQCVEGSGQEHGQGQALMNRARSRTHTDKPKSQQGQPWPHPANAGAWAGRAGAQGHSVLLGRESPPGSAPRTPREALGKVPRGEKSPGSLAFLLSCWPFGNLNSDDEVDSEMVLSCRRF